MMKRLNLFNDDDAIGSIYDVSGRFLVDMDNVYGVLWIKNPTFINLDLLGIFIRQHKTIEIAAEFDTVPGETYIIRIHDRFLYIIDKNGMIVFKDRCPDACMEDDTEGDMRP